MPDYQRFQISNLPSYDIMLDTIRNSNECSLKFAIKIISDLGFDADKYEGLYDFLNIRSINRNSDQYIKICMYILIKEYDINNNIE
jgi:hypothetical protein